MMLSVNTDKSTIYDQNFCNSSFYEGDESELDLALQAPLTDFSCGSKPLSSVGNGFLLMNASKYGYHRTMIPNTPSDKQSTTETTPITQRCLGGPLTGVVIET